MFEDTEDTTPAGSVIRDHQGSSSKTGWARDRYNEQGLEHPGIQLRSAYLDCLNRIYPRLLLLQAVGELRECSNEKCHIMDYVASASQLLSS